MLGVNGMFLGATAGVYPAWQVLKPGNQVLEGEANMDGELERFRRKAKLERVAAYRQIQGLGHQIFQLTQKRHTIDLSNCLKKRM